MKVYGRMPRCLERLGFMLLICVILSYDVLIAYQMQFLKCSINVIYGHIES